MPLTTLSPASETPRRSAGPSAHEVAAARDALCVRLGYRFNDPGLLELALRHRSWCAEHSGVESNERLEFLGDSVLGVVVTDHLYRDAPGTSEGVLARRRSELVSAVALGGVARQAGLGAALALGRGEERTGGRDKTSILADALEAVIGAVYLDGGIGAATSVVLRLLWDRIEHATSGGPGSDHKSRLQERAAQRFGELPRYVLTEEGPEHQKTFRAEVLVDGRVLGAGEGRTKKEAEQAAAAQACEELDAIPDGATSASGRPGGPDRVDEVAAGDRSGAGDAGPDPEDGHA